MLNIPICLTLCRIVTIPFFVLAFYLPFKWGPLASALIFLMAAITDLFDGFLARYWQQTTRFGAFLDPVADKVMVAVALVLIAEHFHAWWITLPVVTVITREILVSALREWMAKIGKDHSIVVTWISKIKTTVQILALIALLWRPQELVILAGIFALYIATIFTLWSMFLYLSNTWYTLVLKKSNYLD
ncbi:CDP-diacylglycerol--glycerol-3-phosphate 3-phosphatidyltransferase [Candidatus Palibaumannia cicadellinicola]|uniref:CDP-diacylglycerol--glycerol-3-phosphate 3-phosphatidyltransferase n=1 Tax=Baumannia cicadellinicola subsp. Homalodisca coagulata TaxID=374463 RepID=Q1LTM1_BAUCH|nr:CDP-diacylglycerol--glycerol-3-phosphate 3-phosphatidyltransferase [Candidatus Baumannia cicadellinicola]ABF13827.1 CDP-diacylglycerol--glycerol-3-phosphate 3-phosphatidyltransferase [Baumannia cicadellinicola str. Hc (Homalodisca coagulata)]MCJ7462324.1 CDP-diacylglycerol--glycerol-3-phosphate 3-phosphatidyltransferase [Candidatus Baumannia cicadellinicola]MCJ7462935.1 CDP-diacylglycerol--glycerol-3-phosphate 3-phosphatidyltransferase [Candidatus Baumannia cicadellinicola]